MAQVAGLRPVGVGAHRHLRIPVEGRRNLRAVDVRLRLPGHGSRGGQRLGGGVRLPDACTDSPRYVVGGGLRDGSCVYVDRPEHIVPTVFPRTDPVRGGDVLGAGLSALDRGIVGRLGPGDDVPRSYGGVISATDRTRAGWVRSWGAT